MYWEGGGGSESHHINNEIEFLITNLRCAFTFQILPSIVENRKDKCKYTKVNLSPLSQGQLEGSLFNSYYTEVLRRALLLSLDWSTLPLICTLYCWVLSKEVSSTIFNVFGMTQPRIEPRSPGLLNTIHLANEPVRKHKWILFKEKSIKLEIMQ